MQQQSIQTDIVSLDYPNKTLVGASFSVSMDIQYAFPSQSGLWLAGWLYDRDTGQPLSGSSYDSTYLQGEQELGGTYHAGVGVRAPSTPTVLHLSAIAAYCATICNGNWYYQNNSVWRIDFDVSVLSVSQAKGLTITQIVNVQSPTQVFGGDSFTVNVTIVYATLFTALNMRIGIRDQANPTGTSLIQDQEAYSEGTGGEAKTITYTFLLNAVDTSGIIGNAKKAGPWNLIAFLSYTETYNGYYADNPISSTISSGTAEKTFQVDILNLADYYSVKIESVNYPSFVLPGQEFKVDVTIAYKLASPVPVEVSMYSADELAGNVALTPDLVSTGNESSELPIFKGNGTYSGYWTLRAPSAEIFRQGLALTGQDTMTLVITVEARVRPRNLLMWVTAKNTPTIKILNITMNEIITYTGIALVVIVLAIVILRRRTQFSLPSLTIVVHQGKGTKKKGRRGKRFCMHCGRDLSSMPSDIKSCPYCQKSIKSSPSRD